VQVPKVQLAVTTSHHEGVTAGHPRSRTSTIATPGGDVNAKSDLAFRPTID
jgi:hypothetical protein